jgi:hypothetical protein
MNGFASKAAVERMLSFMQGLADSHDAIAAIFVQLCRIEMACPLVEAALGCDLKTMHR